MILERLWSNVGQRHAYRPASSATPAGNPTRSRGTPAPASSAELAEPRRHAPAAGLARRRRPNVVQLETMQGDEHAPPQ